MPRTPASPLKSALKSPGVMSTKNPLSPTWREEDLLEKREEVTEKEQARDLAIKTKVRMAKFALRGVSFSCSLIILAMVSSSFAIFNATKSLPNANGLPAWANNTTAWPAQVALGCSCFSLAMCVIVFLAYCRGGHKRAEKVGVYYTIFAISFFIFDLIMWAAAAGILQITRQNSNNQDIWGWSCVQNKRAEEFGNQVDYALVCRLQSWAMICMIIEITVAIFTITLYSVVFYRYWSKRRLHKTMDMRDKARSDLYLAQLKLQSAPNTPGFGAKSPTFSQYAMSPRFPPSTYQSLGALEEDNANASPFTPGGQRLVDRQSSFSQQVETKPFKLQAAPAKATPATPKVSSPVTPTSSSATASLPPPPPGPPPRQGTNSLGHGPVAPGEQQYDAVPIPGAYANAAIKSPPPTQTSFGRTR